MYCALLSLAHKMRASRVLCMLAYRNEKSDAWRYTSKGIIQFHQEGETVILSQLRHDVALSRLAEGARG